MTTTPDQSEGWVFPTPAARKCHYMRDGRSLCGSYAWPESFNQFLQPDTKKPSRLDCTRCRRGLTS